MITWESHCNKLSHYFVTFKVKKKVYNVKLGLHEVPHYWLIPAIKAGEKLDAFRFIIDLVCREYDQTEKAVMSKNRKAELRVPRQIIMTLLCENFPDISLAKIGRRCGGKDHATVLHAKKTILNWTETNKEFKSKYNRLNEMVKMRIDRFYQSHKKPVLKGRRRK